jgi:hypothetical protein
MLFRTVHELVTEGKKRRDAPAFDGFAENLAALHRFQAWVAMRSPGWRRYYGANKPMRRLAVRSMWTQQETPRMPGHHKPSIV